MEKHAIVLTYLDVHKVYIFDSLEEARNGLKILYERCLKWTTERNVSNPIIVLTNDWFEIKGAKDLILGDNTIEGNVVHVSPSEQLRKWEPTKKKIC